MQESLLLHLPSNCWPVSRCSSLWHVQAHCSMMLLGGTGINNLHVSSCRENVPAPLCDPGSFDLCRSQCIPMNAARVRGSNRYFCPPAQVLTQNTQLCGRVSFQKGTQDALHIKEGSLQVAKTTSHPGALMSLSPIPFWQHKDHVSNFEPNNLQSYFEGRLGGTLSKSTPILFKMESRQGSDIKHMRPQITISA